MQSFDINQIEQEEFISKCLFVMEIKTIIILPFYILALLCIFMKSQNFQKHYKTILAVHVFFCLSEEIYGCIFMRPAVFLPIIGIYTNGILSNIFHIHPYIQIVGYFLIIHLNAGVILHISLYRLKMVIPMSFRFYNVLAVKGKWFLVLMYIYCFISMSAFGLLIENQAEAKIYLSQTVSPLPTIFWSDKYVVSSAKSQNFQTFIHYSVFFVINNVVICFIVVISAFRILERTKANLSARVVEAQQSYLRVLLIQVIVVIVFLIIPFSLFGINMKYDLRSLTLLISAIFLTISHGSFSTLTLILGTKSYRQEFTRIFGKCECFSCTNRHLLHNNIISPIG